MALSRRQHQPAAPLLAEVSRPAAALIHNERRPLKLKNNVKIADRE